MNKKFLSLAALISVAALFAIGCGGDDGSSSSDEPAPTEAAPTRAAYIAEADAICTAGEADMAAIDENLPDDLDPAEARVAAAEEAIAVLRDRVEQLRALTPPEGDEEETAAIFDAYDEFVELGEEDPGFTDVSAAEEAQAKIRNLASDYGFKACAR